MIYWNDGTLIKLIKQIVTDCYLIIAICQLNICVHYFQ